VEAFLSQQKKIGTFPEMRNKLEYLQVRWVMDGIGELLYGRIINVLNGIFCFFFHISDLFRGMN
jgi:hypothetical protein